MSRARNQSGKTDIRRFRRSEGFYVEFKFLTRLVLLIGNCKIVHDTGSALHLNCRFRRNSGNSHFVPNDETSSSYILFQNGSSFGS